jgi:hypothetical protein
VLIAVGPYRLQSSSRLRLDEGKELPEKDDCPHPERLRTKLY